MDVIERIRGCRISLAIIAIEADVPEDEIAAALEGTQALRFLQESRIARYLDRQKPLENPSSGYPCPGPRRRP
ncbi:hypothetical protein [Rhodovulum sp. MB263]|uniref:hypothetical protein n=1 Tax=unclassified Rhodovulum TaxID=2631432 RepID=UPI0009B7811F|nr:hypothetical protein [Rhodovulum sp. MB263]ARC88009.1 hypothetical protein B5V46_04970 [Rhodovulum sp. MB263]